MGIVLIFVLHTIINMCTMGVSLYLAFELTQRFSNEDEEGATNATPVHSDSFYNIILILIIILALMTSFIGKFISNKIFIGINKRLHDRIVQKVLQSKIQFFESNT